MIPMTEQAPELLGSPAFIPDDGKTYAHNQRLGKLKIYSPVISLDFVFLLFNSPYLRHEFAKTCSGITARHTSPKKILKVPFTVCPSAEQKRIVSKVSVLHSQLDELSTEMRSHQPTTDALPTAIIHQILNQDDSRNCLLYTSPSPRDRG